MIFNTTDDGQKLISFCKKAEMESANFCQQLQKDKAFLTQYFNATGNVAAQQSILNNSSTDASDSAIEYAINAKGAAGSVSHFEKQQLKANSSILQSTTNFNLSTISANVYKLALKGVAIAANTASTVLLSGIVYAFSKLFTAQNEAIQKAKELTSTYKTNNTSLENYKKQIHSILIELKANNVSYDTSKQKRQELMNIQDELFKKYGTEAQVIKAITAAINGEIDALDTLSQKSYYEWLSSVDTLTGGEKFANALFTIFTGIPNQYKSALDSAIDYMESEKQIFYIKPTGNLELDNLIQDKLGLQKNSLNEFIIKDMIPDEAYELLSEIRTTYRQYASQYLGTETDNILTKTNNSIQSAMSSLDAELSKHQEIYHTYLEGMIKYDSEYSTLYTDLLSKQISLEEAESNSYETNAQQKIFEAKKEFYNSLTNALASSQNNPNVKRFFRNLYPDLYSKFPSWNFKYDISTNTERFDNAVKELGN